jgi:hypothetical protein
MYTYRCTVQVEEGRSGCAPRLNNSSAKGDGAMQKHLLRSRADALRWCERKGHPSPLISRGGCPLGKTEGAFHFVALHTGRFSHLPVALCGRGSAGRTWSAAASTSRFWSYGCVSLGSEYCAVEAEPVGSPGRAAFVCCAPAWGQGVRRKTCGARFLHSSLVQGLAASVEGGIIGFRNCCAGWLSGAKSPDPATAVPTNRPRAAARCGRPADDGRGWRPARLHSGNQAEGRRNTP